MAERGTISRIIIPVVCLLVTAAGLNNVYGDSGDVERLAESAACGGEHCSVKMVEMSKTPFGHKYVYQTNVDNQTTARVECAREYVLVGSYECEKK